MRVELVYIYIHTRGKLYNFLEDFATADSAYLQRISFAIASACTEFQDRRRRIPREDDIPVRVRSGISNESRICHDLAAARRVASHGNPIVCQVIAYTPTTHRSVDDFDKFL